MEGSRAQRAYLAAAAAMFLCLVVVLIATTRASGAGDQPAGASKSAVQLSKLKKQVASLQAQIDQLSKQPGPPGPPGPQGPPGTLSGTISGGVGGQLLDNTVDNADLAPNAEFSGTAVPNGGDLDGFYPTPTLEANTVQDSEIASNAVGFDELKPSSVGSLEVNDGALDVQDSAESFGVETAVPWDGTSDITAGCVIDAGIVASGADSNDIVVATPDKPGVSSAAILYLSASVTTGAFPGFDTITIAGCNPYPTAVDAPDQVSWAVFDVP